MNSLLMSIAARYLVPLLWILSICVLYRGHNLPGGGFIGGLLGASAILLIALVEGWDRAKRATPFEPITIMIIGLSIAILSGFVGIFAGGNFLQGIWLPFFDAPLLGKVKLGTPLLFDVGVYFVVIGFTVKSAQALGTEEG
ncbi:MAG: MnhB domain-containing protein [Opitutales bacterium]